MTVQLPNHGFHTDEDRAATEGKCSKLDRRRFDCSHLGTKLTSTEILDAPVDQVYVRHGYFEYEVDRMEQALEHAEVIMAGRTYRRSTSAGDVEVHHAYKVKVKGPGLNSEYLDTFKRT